MSLRDHVLAAMKKHSASHPKTNYSKVSKVDPRREKSGAPKSDDSKPDAGGDGEDEDNKSNEHYAKKHRSHIKNKKENQRGKLNKKHPGFKAVQSSIEKEGYSHKVAGAILAARSRGASASAKHANPHLNRVKG